jgi:hypothetical protein
MKDSRKYNIFCQGTNENILELRDHYWQLCASLQDAQNSMLSLLNQASGIANVVRLHELKQTSS